MSNYYNRQWRLPNAWNGTESNVNKQSNYSVDFDGSSQYIDIVNSSTAPTSLQSLGNSNSYSISSWIKTIVNDSTTFYWFTNDTIIELRTENSSGTHVPFNLSLLSGKLFFARTPDRTASFQAFQSSTSVNTGSWVHCVATVDNNTLKLYINGSLDSTHTFTSATGDCSVGSNTSNLFIGSRSTDTGGNEGYFTGQIDAVCIFNYALSSSQVTTLYGSSSTGIGNPMSLSPKPVAMYNLGDKSVFNSSSYLIPNDSLKDYVFSFDANSSINCGTISTLTSSTNFSISGWFNQTTVDQTGFMLGARSSSTDAVFLYTYSDGNMYVDVSNSSQSYGYFDYSTVVSANTWFHVAMVFNGTGSANADKLKLYINGSPITLTYYNTIPSSTTSSTNDFKIGVVDGYTNEWNGSISNVQIFNTALPATGSNSVETLYNNGSPLTSMSGFTSLVGFWKLDASELYSDKWSVENNASPTTFKSALNFNGSNDYIDVGSSGNVWDGTTSLSVSLWVNLNSTGTFQYLIDSNTLGNAYIGFGIQLQSNGKFAYCVKDDTNFIVSYYVNDIGFTYGNWHHIVLVYDRANSNYYYYNNGTPYTITPTVSSHSHTAFADLYIGRPSQSNNYYTDGKISNVAIYDTALSASNIQTLYNNGVPQATIYGSPVAHYKLDNTTTGIQDSAGSNNGTNNGATEVGTYVNTTAGNSSGMTQSALQQSDLSFKTSFSPYAFDFDGTNQTIGTNYYWSTGNTAKSISLWFYKDSGDATLIGGGQSSSGKYFGISSFSYNSRFKFDIYPSIPFSDNSAATGKWQHVVVTAEPSGSDTILNGYVDGDLDSEFPQTITGGINTGSTAPVTIGENNVLNYNKFPNGKISNISIWNAALTSSQVREIYNDGVPANLNNYSAYSNLVSWWQLGSNSSFNTNWTVLDEKGSNNGTSVNMTEDDIVDGVGSYANGLSSGMGGDEVIGDAPYSTANALSLNMDVEDRVSDTPS